MLTDAQKQLIAEWNQASQQLKYWKERESALRTNLITSVADASKEKGVQTLEVASGWKLKITKNLDYKLDAKDGQLVAAMMSIEAVDVRNGLIRWKPELSIKVYNTLSPEQSSILTPFLTIKPASPQVELVAPEPPK